MCACAPQDLNPCSIKQHMSAWAPFKAAFVCTGCLKLSWNIIKASWFRDLLRWQLLADWLNKEITIKGPTKSTSESCQAGKKKLQILKKASEGVLSSKGKIVLQVYCLKIFHKDAASWILLLQSSYQNTWPSLTPYKPALISALSLKFHWPTVKYSVMGSRGLRLAQPLCRWDNIKTIS